MYIVKCVVWALAISAVLRILIPLLVKKEDNK